MPVRVHLQLIIPTGSARSILDKKGLITFPVLEIESNPDPFLCLPNLSDPGEQIVLCGQNDGQVALLQPLVFFVHVLRRDSMRLRGSSGIS